MNAKVQYSARNWIPVSIKGAMAKSPRRKIWQNLKAPRDRCVAGSIGNLGAVLGCTLERFSVNPHEYERILGMPIVESSMYFHRGYYPAWGTWRDG
ncbi:hypothetical protein CR513_32989, partial [Mucuna pruriens]